MSEGRFRFLLCYDIREPRRLGRVHRYVRKYGLAVQRSVFYLECSRSALSRVVDGLEQIIDAGEDDIRVYAVGNLSGARRLGPDSMPSQVMLC